MDPLAYCARKAAPPGSSLHYALLFAQRQRRADLLALHAWRSEVLETVDECSDADVARVKLSFWHEELERIFAGQARHPAGQALQPAVNRHGLPREELDELLAAAAMDLEYDAYPDLRALTVYCHRSGGSVTRLAARICGAHDPAEMAFAHDLGMAFPLTGQLRRLRRNLAAGRIYIPEDEMQRHQLSAGALARASGDEAPVRSLLRAQGQRALAFYRSALERLPETRRDRVLPMTILARLYLTLMEEMDQAGYPILQRRLHLTPIRKFWIASRTAWRERRQA